MMTFPIEHASLETLPLLQEIPQPPAQLNYRGTLPPPDLKLVSIVGSRKYTSYGKQVVEHLVSNLRDYPVGIVSGLALGIDSLAHEAALRAGLYTMAIPGSGIDDAVIYPASHKPLARRILESGGCLLSEFEPTFRATKWSFVQRNRIMAGISHATLVIEASEKSGTLVTARLASDFNRDLLVVPGNIFAHNSAGAHQFLKLGATPVTVPDDILYALGIDPHKKQTQSTLEISPEEQKLVDALSEPREKDTLIRMSGIETSKANMLLMQLEMRGIISNQNGTIYRNK